MMDDACMHRVHTASDRKHRSAPNQRLNKHGHYAEEDTRRVSPWRHTQRFMRNPLAPRSTPGLSVVAAWSREMRRNVPNQCRKKKKVRRTHLGVGNDVRQASGRRRRRRNVSGGAGDNCGLAATAAARRGGGACGLPCGVRLERQHPAHGLAALACTPGLVNVT